MADILSDATESLEFKDWRAVGFIILCIMAACSYWLDWPSAFVWAALLAALLIDSLSEVPQGVVSLFLAAVFLAFLGREMLLGLLQTGDWVHFRKIYLDFPWWQPLIYGGAAVLVCIILRRFDPRIMHMPWRYWSMMTLVFWIWFWVAMGDERWKSLENWPLLLIFLIFFMSGVFVGIKRERATKDDDNRYAEIGYLESKIEQRAFTFAGWAGIGLLGFMVISVCFLPAGFVFYEFAVKPMLRFLGIKSD